MATSSFSNFSYIQPEYYNCDDFDHEKENNQKSIISQEFQWDISKFECLDCIGMGEYATVYRARRGDQYFAVKKIQIFDMDGQNRKKCQQEVNILQNLPPHPNIIRFFHSCINQDNELFLILELCEMGNLASLILHHRQEGKRFEEKFIWKIIFEISQVNHDSSSSPPRPLYPPS